MLKRNELLLVDQHVIGFTRFVQLSQYTGRALKVYLEKKFQRVKRTSFEFFSGEFSTFFAEIWEECCPINHAKRRCQEIFRFGLYKKS